MTDLESIFERLGLETYLDAFLAEGFDSWETVLDIQESDLDALNVKLGHRRKLQREIANQRGISYDTFVRSPTAEPAPEAPRTGDESEPVTAPIERWTSSGVETKRKYRRHPKPDENAPTRPPSAYVIFSNTIREEIKNRNLSFTAIAKLVGERWQNLNPKEREPFETEATSAKERYNLQLFAYRKTESYREHLRYLRDFKAKHEGTTLDRKRVKTGQQSSSESSQGRATEHSDPLPHTPVHDRPGSFGSISSGPRLNSLPSPLSHIGPFAHPAHGAGGYRLSPLSPRADSTCPSYAAKELAFRAPLSNDGSVSDESIAQRDSQADPLSRTSQLSLSTPGTGTPPSANSTVASLPGMSMTTSRTDSGRRSSGPLYHSRQFDTKPPSEVPSAQILLQNVPLEEAWSPGHGNEVPGRGLSALSQTLYPALGSSPPSIALGARTLPPLMQSERTAGDRRPDPHVRMLPLPRLSPPGLSQQGIRNIAGISSEHGHGQDARSSSGRGDTGTVGPPDTSESEAVSTLAGLGATIEKDEDEQRGRGRVRPPG